MTTLAALFARIRTEPVHYPVDLLAKRRVCFQMQAYRVVDPVGSRLDDLAAAFVTKPENLDELIAKAGELLAKDPHDIAVSVARYNVAHVSAKNKAWAERRLQEELEKAVKRNK
jgi:hypothetical protein